MLDFSLLVRFWLFFPDPRLTSTSSLRCHLHLECLSSRVVMQFHHSSQPALIPVPPGMFPETTSLPFPSSSLLFWTPRPTGACFSFSLFPVASCSLDLQGWIFRVGVFLSALCLLPGKMVLEFGCIGPGIIWPLSVINTNIKLSTMFTKHNIKTIKHLYNRILKW